MLARLVLNAVVFQLDQSHLQTKTRAYSLGKCIERMVLTHSREICVRFAFGFTLLVFFVFLFLPCFTRHRLLLAIFGLRPVVQPSGV